MRTSIILLVTIRFLLITNSLLKEIHEYISSSTALSVELEQELDKLAEDGNLFKTDFSFTKRFEKVNGRKQKEIEKFLKKKEIETEYFHK